MHETNDPYAGLFELPGGRLEGRETPLQAAMREWEEETGLRMPQGDLTGHWTSSDGKYEGYVLTIPSEDGIDLLGNRDEVANPDDPDGDLTEAIAWIDPGHLKGNPSIRPEILCDLDMILRALNGDAND